MRTSPVVTTLKALIETCSDAVHRFRACADHANNPLLRAMLNECLQQRTRWREELQAILTPLQKQGTAPRTFWPLHAGWITVRCAFSSEHPDHLVVEECRRGEQFVMARYQESLKQKSLKRLEFDAASGASRIEAVVRRQLIDMRKDDRRIAAFGASRCMPVRRRQRPAQAQAHVARPDTQAPETPAPQAPTRLPLQMAAVTRRKPGFVTVSSHIDS